VLSSRERYPDKNIAFLYSPDKMPEEVRSAHHDLDRAIELCYRSKPFTSDEERLEYLFALYEQMNAAEAGELFAPPVPTKVKPKAKKS
jgi:hypothetical protein